MLAVERLGMTLAGDPHDARDGGKTTVATPGNGADPVTYLLHHGYTQVTSYQPNSRYWTFQWIEFGWLTTLAALLLCSTFLLMRRRDAWAQTSKTHRSTLTHIVTAPEASRRDISDRRLQTA